MPAANVIDRPVSASDRPWFIDRRESGDVNTVTVLGDGGRFVVARLISEASSVEPIDAANAAYICRCVNAHGDLVGRLSDITRAYNRVECACTIPERDSGHRTDCVMPVLRELQGNAVELLRRLES